MQKINTYSKPRYSVPRKYLNFDANDWLRCLKMLAWVIKQREAVGQYELWKRLEQLCEDVIRLCTGDDGVSFKKLRDHTYAVQGQKITLNKIYQRADKAERYKEFNIQKVAVTQSYELLTNVTTERDIRRAFSDEEVTVATKRQGHVCLICKGPISSLNPPVGDHVIPWSMGGRTVQDNCAAIHVICNQQKGAMSLLEYMQKRGMESARGRKKIYED